MNIDNLVFWYRSKQSERKSAEFALITVWSEFLFILLVLN